MSLRTASATLGSVALLLATCFAVAPDSDPVQFGGIGLSQSVITLTATTQIKTKLTAIGWQESSSGVNITVHPQQGAAVRVGGTRGDTSHVVPAGGPSVVEITMVDATTLKADLVITPPPPALPLRAPLTILTRGEFDEFSKVEPPYLDEFGHVLNDPTRSRVRLWINYYGMRTAITLMDG